MVIVRGFREAWRRLSRRPGYALLSIMVLGVGLGVTLFAFSLINTLVLDPLPFLQRLSTRWRNHPCSNVQTPTSVFIR